MTKRETNGAALGFAIGAFLGYLFFNDGDEGSFFAGTLVPTLLMALIGALIVYYIVKQTAAKERQDRL